MGLWDRTGTASVANGSPLVTGSGTTWNTTARIGDAVYFGNGTKPYEILSIESNYALTLAENFTETTQVAGSFRIVPCSPRHTIASDVLEQLRRILTGRSEFIETSGPPIPTIVDRSLAIDPVARVYYYLTDGVWGDAVSLGGADGVDAGFKVTFDDATGMADPGNGFIRFNNATRASVTAIAIDDLSADGGNPDVSNYILTWDDGTNTPVRGTLILRKVGSPQNFAIFSITGNSTDNSGWTQLAVTHVLSGGTFADNDVLSAVFIRAGDRGTAGIDGVSAGPVWTLSTNTTMADPGDGILRFNNATLASATALAIDAKSAAAGNPSLASFINTWDDSSNSAMRGTLTFTKLGAMQNYAIFQITGAVTDNSGWHQLSIAYVNGGGTLANNDVLVVQFDRTGNAGVDGVSTGFEFAFSSATGMADPGDGTLRFNNATFASVTAIAIDDKSNDTGTPDVSVAILAWDDSTNLDHRGLLTIRKKSARGNYVQFAITGATTDNTGWSQLAVTHVASAGSFSASDVLIVEFARTGDKGAAGADGAGSVSTVNSVAPSGGNVVIGASDIAVAATPTNVSPGGSSVNDWLAAIDTALASGTNNAETTIGSAGTVDIGGAATGVVVITGTTTITSFGTVANKLRTVRFAGALTLTYNATTLILPGASNFNTQAGDIATFLSDASGNWRMVSVQRFDESASQDVMAYKGSIACAANPNYPAASAGHVYRVSSAGKIGGASGINVEIGDQLVCNVDATASGNHATVGANWTITQANIDGAVVGPASAVSANLARYSGTSGKIIDDSGVAVSTSTALGTSNALLPTQNAVKSYVDTAVAGAGGWTMVMKTADQSRSATTTLANDNTLTFAVAANTKYVIRMRIGFTAGGTPDFKWTLTGPASPTSVAIAGVEVTTSAVALPVNEIAFAVSRANTGNGSGCGCITAEIYFQNGSNAGNVTFQWAQNTSDAGNVTVLAGSHFEYRTV